MDTAKLILAIALMALFTGFPIYYAANVYFIRAGSRVLTNHVTLKSLVIGLAFMGIGEVFGKYRVIDVALSSAWWICFVLCIYFTWKGIPKAGI